MRYFVGIDIGSTSAKTVVLDQERKNVCRMVCPTGWSSVETAEKIREQLEEQGIEREQSLCVATGYGRVSVPYADQCVTEITCHARGASRIYGEGPLKVIDIGGQDTKIICVTEGKVRDFLMNDKCSAGTGRFLEVMANLMGIRIEELCEMAFCGKDTSISSMCTVFAESEVISLIGRGEPKENIAYAIVNSIVRRVAAQASRLNCGDGKWCLTGGLCECGYIRKALSDCLGEEVTADPEGRFAGALGAALLADRGKTAR